MNAPEANSTRQKGFAIGSMDGHHTGTGGATRSLGRPIGPQWHLTQLLEGLTLTIHQPVRLKLKITGRPGAIDLTGVLHR
jgi:hypothetical protein